MLHKLIYFKYFVFLIAVFNTATLAQKTVPSLEDISEAILINNKPVLKVSCPDGGGATEIKLLSHDNEEALVFDVAKLAFKRPIGKLFITRTKVIFEPLEYKNKRLDLNKSELTKTIAQDANPNIFRVFTYTAKESLLKIEFNNDEAKFVIKFDHDDETVDINSQNTVHHFIYTAISNFDEALVIFNKLTASVRK